MTHQSILALRISRSFRFESKTLADSKEFIPAPLRTISAFSGDHPFRIEFEGDKVASIRTFDPSSQLSIEKKEEVTIIPDIRINREKKIKYDPLLEFLPEKSVIWVQDMQFALEVMDKEAEGDHYLDGEGFLDKISSFPLIEFGSHSFFITKNPVLYSVSPQPSFNKNFDLLIKDLLENSRKGIKNMFTWRNNNRRDNMMTFGFSYSSFIAHVKM